MDSYDFTNQSLYFFDFTITKQTGMFCVKRDNEVKDTF